MADSVRMPWWRKAQDAVLAGVRAENKPPSEDFAHLARRIASVVDAAERSAVLLREQARRDADALEARARERAAQLEQAGQRMREEAELAAARAREATARDAQRVVDAASEDARTIVGSAQRKAAGITAAAHRHQHALERAIAAAEQRLELLAVTLHGAATTLEHTLDARREAAVTSTPAPAEQPGVTPTGSSQKAALTGEPLEPMTSPES